MIVECSRCRNIPQAMLTLRDSGSHDSKCFQTVPRTSTTIKERDKVAISSILGTHEAKAENGSVFPRSRLPSFTRATTESGRSNSRMSTDECVCAHSHRESLSHIRALL